MNKELHDLEQGSIRERVGETTVAQALSLRVMMFIRGCAGTALRAVQISNRRR